MRRHIAAPAADRGAAGGPAEAHDGAASTAVTVAPSSAAPRRPRVAAIVTAYFPQSHADVVVSKLITGYSTDDGFVAPSVDVVSLYIDQVVLPAFDNHVAPEAQTASLTTPGGRNPADIGLGIAAAHGIPVYSTIPRALYEGDHHYAEGGSTTLDIDGVIMIVRVPPLPLQDPSHHLRLSRTYDCAMITASDGRPATALHNASCRASMATTRRTSWDVAFTRSATSSSRSLVGAGKHSFMRHVLGLKPINCQDRLGTSVRKDEISKKKGCFFFPGQGCSLRLVEACRSSQTSTSGKTTGLLSTYYLNINQTTKTGSGQTQGNAKTKTRFLLQLLHRRCSLDDETCRPSRDPAPRRLDARDLLAPPELGVRSWRARACGGLLPLQRRRELWLRG
jgi:hypothetical protein